MLFGHRPAFCCSTRCGLLRTGLLGLSPLVIFLFLTNVGPLSASPELAASPELLAELSDGPAPTFGGLDPAVPNPAEVLGYPVGARFTRHHRVVDYFETLARQSPRAELRTYGQTYEGRPLHLLLIANAKNLGRLEALRQGNLKLAEPAAFEAEELDRLASRQPAVVWLAFGVHGNESSTAEAAMATAYLLTAGKELVSLLDDVVVVLDPVVNPDGRERFVQSYLTRRGLQPDPYAGSYEHREPWPGGRQNHYLIDLNRDWAWLSQTETRQRLAVYRQWEPQVYVDFHEMSSDSSYFFPPSAEPVHPEISATVVEWLDVFGSGNAAAFDAQGWPYYVADVFDLFYPGYGDSYPSLRGAVGMTYEVAGGGRAGQDLQLEDGRRLSLADRVARHVTAALATVRTAADRREALLQDFMETRGRHQREPTRFYLWDGKGASGDALADLLELHGLKVQALSKEATMPLRTLNGETVARRALAAGTLAVSTDQPLGALLRTLMEPRFDLPAAFVEEQRQRVERNQRMAFFDVTAWSLPLAFDVQTWVADEAAPPLGPRPKRVTRTQGEGRVGFLLPPDGLARYRLLNQLRRRAPIRVRRAQEPFDLGSGELPAGTLFLPRRGNPPELAQWLEELVPANGAAVLGARSIRAESGPSLGSDRMPTLGPARLGLLAGEGVVATSHGFLWHFLEEGVQQPLSRLDLGILGSLDLRSFDVLILPRVRRAAVLEGASGEKLASWVRAGGTLIAVGDEVYRWLNEAELTEIETWTAEQAEGAESSSWDDKQLAVPGAVVATKLAPRHPLGASLAQSPAVLFEGDTFYLPTGDPRTDVLTVRDKEPVLGGFVLPEVEGRLSGALLVAAERAGRGRVVFFAQEPVFRLFWRSTAPLLMDAILLGGRSPGF